MPRGGVRIGAGRPRLAAAEHLARGTFRVDRHGPRPSNVVPMPAPSESWTPTSADLGGVGDAGRALLERVLSQYEPSTIEGLQLLEVAKAADTLATLRTADAPDLRQLRLWSAYFTMTLRTLGLTK